MKTMQRKLMLILVLALLSAPSCALLENPGETSELQRYNLASQAFTALVETAADLYDIGELDDDDLQTVYLVAIGVDRALDAWDAAIRMGNDPAEAREQAKEEIEGLRDLIKRVQDE